MEWGFAIDCTSLTYPGNLIWFFHAFEKSSRFGGVSGISILDVSTRMSQKPGKNIGGQSSHGIESATEKADVNCGNVKACPRSLGMRGKEDHSTFRSVGPVSGRPWLTMLMADERVAEVSFTDSALSVTLKDGRTITVPLTWYPRLLDATPEQRMNWKVVGGGYGIHWSNLDEDLRTEGLLRGAPAPGKAR